ncbi:MAG: hypothetical protein ABSF38_14645 [Verrucomicrobiota bacterium]
MNKIKRSLTIFSNCDSIVSVKGEGALMRQGSWSAVIAGLPASFPVRRLVRSFPGLCNFIEGGSEGASNSVKASQSKKCGLTANTAILSEMLMINEFKPNQSARLVKVNKGKKRKYTTTRNVKTGATSSSLIIRMAERGGFEPHLNPRIHWGKRLSALEKTLEFQAHLVAICHS